MHQSYNGHNEKSLMDIQRRYKEKHPEYWIRDGKMYSEHPAFEGGKNVVCGFNDQGTMVVFGPIFPALAEEGEEEPHTFWMDLLYDPWDESLQRIKDQVFEGMLERGMELKKELKGHPCRFATLQQAHHHENMDYYFGKGFRETTRLLTMRRDLDSLSYAGDGSVIPYRLKTEEEIKRYLEADRKANPGNPMTREKLLWNLKHPWKNGTGYGIFHENGDLIASIMTYSLEKDVTMTEEIFVIPEHQGKGLGEALLGQVLLSLKNSGVKQAELEVKEDNRPARSLYEKLGYTIAKEESTLILDL